MPPLDGAPPPPAILPPPPVPDGGRLEDEPLELDGLPLVDEPDEAGRTPEEDDDEPGGFGAPTGALGNALPTAEPVLELLTLEAGFGEVGTLDITILGYEFDHIGDASIFPSARAGKPRSNEEGMRVFGIKPGPSGPG